MRSRLTLWSSTKGNPDGLEQLQGNFADLHAVQDKKGAPANDSRSAGKQTDAAIAAGSGAGAAPIAAGGGDGAPSLIPRTHGAAASSSALGTGVRRRLLAVLSLATAASVALYSREYTAWCIVAFTVLVVLMEFAAVDEQQTLTKLKVERDDLAAKVEAMQKERDTESKLQGEKLRRREARIKRLEAEVEKLRALLHTRQESRSPSAARDARCTADDRACPVKRTLRESFAASLEGARARSLAGRELNKGPEAQTENCPEAGCKSQ